MIQTKSQILAETLLEITDRQDLTEFLEGLLTPAEIDQLVIRLEVIRLLKQGLPQRQIAQKLGVGIATVTRGSRELGLGRFGQITA